ncbi:TlpA family protein disulfide reductase [Actinomadura namibiensis]
MGYIARNLIMLDVGVRRGRFPMPYLVAAVILLAVLSVFNLMLILGVVRRLRRDDGEAVPLLPAGTVVPEFTVMTTAGEVVTRDSLGGALVGFFSPGCSACEVQLPKFAARAAGRRAVAVLHGNEEETRAHRDALGGAAEVVIEEPDGPMGAAFAVDGYPTFVVIDPNGTVTASSHAVDRLPLPKPAETVS